jgi:hypothetical protein
VTRETTASERYPDVADILKHGTKSRRRNLIEIAGLTEHRQQLSGVRGTVRVMFPAVNLAALLHQR